MEKILKETLKILDNYIFDIKEDIQIRENSIVKKELSNEKVEIDFKEHQTFMIGLRKEEIKKVEENKKDLEKLL